ncbi:hypothetical protein B0T18DRAFT_6788 [Schizothecium vesticola]|uniref:Uncharacterized protein n=1 Tax=Schizothecium vesticola TaxID=314040 RepID=A0AA40F8F1_9PEZI|nr:hypothetical protein B0T18DRAFT_6788 [Schizothecium vesticola]
MAIGQTGSRLDGPNPSKSNLLESLQSPPMLLPRSVPVLQMPLSLPLQIPRYKSRAARSNVVRPSAVHLCRFPSPFVFPPLVCMNECRMCRRVRVNTTVTIMHLSPHRLPPPTHPQIDCVSVPGGSQVGQGQDVDGWREWGRGNKQTRLNEPIAKKRVTEKNTTHRIINKGRLVVVDCCCSPLLPPHQTLHPIPSFPFPFHSSRAAA